MSIRNWIFLSHLKNTRQSITFIEIGLSIAKIGMSCLKEVLRIGEQVSKALERSRFMVWETFMFKNEVLNDC